MQFVLFVHRHLTGHAQEMQQESQGKGLSARKRVAGNYSLVNFFKYALVLFNKLDPFYIELHGT